MRELTKYEAEDGTLFDTADEAYERDEQIEAARVLENADLLFYSGSRPLLIIQTLQKHYILTKKEK